ncbi:MAG: UDP-glucose 4-epimerase GalE, partial [Acidimicrobiia bacterium]|nr:UDP-glucose 4-epimerase GalE [Acidimicrobiia bacterium]
MTDVLVTGGAGYIGSVTVDLLVERGDSVTVLDDLSRGHADQVNAGADFVTGDVGDTDLVRRLMSDRSIESVIHFAGLIAVGESVADPIRYLDVNVARGVALLEACKDTGIGSLVFSSSAAVYGTPDVVPTPESHPIRPESPYGWTKAAFEQMLTYTETAHGLRSVPLRYFNASGASPTRRERHDPETHLIPNILRSARDAVTVKVFGADYDTPDGTAIRDYIHVLDLAEAHLVALDHLASGGPSLAVNVGTGQGHSVLEVIEVARQVTGCTIEIEAKPRRPGDPPRLVADPTSALGLGWS